MTDVKNSQVEEFLSHYGVKGMKGGKRRTRAQKQGAKAIKSYLKTQGL